MTLFHSDAGEGSSLPAFIWAWWEQISKTKNCFFQTESDNKLSLLNVFSKLKKPTTGTIHLSPTYNCMQGRQVIFKTLFKPLFCEFSTIQMTANAAFQIFLTFMQVHSCLCLKKKTKTKDGFLLSVEFFIELFVLPPCRSVKEASRSCVRQGTKGCPGVAWLLWRSGASWCFSSNSISSSTKVSSLTALWLGGLRMWRGRKSAMGKRSLRTACGERRVKEEESSKLWAWKERKLTNILIQITEWKVSLTLIWGFRKKTTTLLLMQTTKMFYGGSGQLKPKMQAAGQESSHSLVMWFCWFLSSSEQIRAFRHDRNIL